MNKPCLNHRPVFVFGRREPDYLASEYIYFQKEFQIYYVSTDIVVGLRSEFVRCAIVLLVLELEL